MSQTPSIALPLPETSQPTQERIKGGGGGGQALPTTFAFTYHFWKACNTPWNCPPPHATSFTIIALLRLPHPSRRIRVFPPQGRKRDMIITHWVLPYWRNSPRGIYHSCRHRSLGNDNRAASRDESSAHIPPCSASHTSAPHWPWGCGPPADMTIPCPLYFWLTPCESILVPHRCNNSLNNLFHCRFFSEAFSPPAG